MARRPHSQPSPRDDADPDPGAPFRWPSRGRAHEAERAASRAARAGLERLRARNVRPGPLPAAPAVAREPDHIPERDPASEPEPAPPLWDEELDELTEQLVAELRRDLGPDPG